MSLTRTALVVWTPNRQRIVLFHCENGPIPLSLVSINKTSLPRSEYDIEGTIVLTTMFCVYINVTVSDVKSTPLLDTCTKTSSRHSAVSFFGTRHVINVLLTHRPFPIPIPSNLHDKVFESTKFCPYTFMVVLAKPFDGVSVEMDAA